MEKYYTPEIEEFHVGFEFETSYPLMQGSLDNWKKVTLELHTNDDFWSLYEGDAISSEFRVKHLDSEDIESLGFEKPKYVETRTTPYYKDNEIRLTHIPDEGYEIATRMKGPEGSDRMKAPWHIKIYRIQIKNKSELKRILKQLGI